jgi:hypothetical protein
MGSKSDNSTNSESDDNSGGERERDIISCLCSKGIDKKELNEYLNLSLVTISKTNSSENKELSTLLTSQMNYRKMDDTIKKVIIFNSIYKSDEMRDFVRKKEHPNRKKRRCIDPAYATDFFSQLSIHCEDYIDSRLNENTFIKNIRKSYKKLKKNK